MPYHIINIFTLYYSRKVPIIGITPLGLDHVTLLGNTIKQIAWHKSGIMKNGSHVFTVPQTYEAMQVLKERSIEKKVKCNGSKFYLCYIYF